jgi:signal transduction histidine kinase/CheY-like chemotaxis protein
MKPLEVETRSSEEHAALRTPKPMDIGPLPYGAAVLAVALAFQGTLWLRPLMEHNVFLLFFTAVVVTAWYGGPGPSLLATVLSAAIVPSFLFYSVRPRTLLLADVPQVGIFVIMSLVISLLSARRKRAEAELHRAHEELEGQVLQRTAELASANRAMRSEMSDRRSLEAQLMQAQKMEAIGILAGGVAHDFNNLLTVINGYSDFLLDDLAQDDPKRSDLEQIRRAGGNAASLTAQLLAFSRKQILQPKIINLNDVIAEMGIILRRLIGEDIDLATVPQPDLGLVQADPGQMQQIIMNLAVNARDAMAQGGKLTIETANVHLDDNYVRRHVEVPAGPYVMLAISDSGVGMDAETQARIFEPFFTTKGPGRGTGLGLSTVYGIVKQSDGFVWVYSEPGMGATFKIYLPLMEGEADKLRSSGSEDRMLKGTETVLVAEDDPLVLTLVARILRERDYDVIEASNTHEALLAIQDPARQVQLAIIDIVIPEIGGKALASRIEATRPDTKVLFVSGYTNKAIVHQGVLDSEVAFLQKPFSADGLARKVREVLDVPR